MTSNNFSKPFSIRIFLPDGTADGVRIIEKSNWTGVGLVVPRSLVPEAKKDLRRVSALGAADCDDR